MMQELSGPNKVVGAKQVKRALRDGRAARLYIAVDADPRLLQPLVQEAVNRQVPVVQVPSMKELGVSCGDCLYVGDTDTDMRTGNRAGMRTVGVTWGFRERKELEENGAEKIIQKSPCGIHVHLYV